MRYEFKEAVKNIKFAVENAVMHFIMWLLAFFLWVFFSAIVIGMRLTSTPHESDVEDYKLLTRFVFGWFIRRE